MHNFDESNGLHSWVTPVQMSFVENACVVIQTDVEYMFDTP